MSIFIQSFFNKNKRVFFFLFIFVIILLYFVIGFNFKKGDFSLISDNYINVHDKNINVFIADTSESRRNGLSIFDSLDFNEAMLFIFDQEDYYGFWMKNMKFSIDIVWLDNNKKVIFIKENAKPSDYPEIYKPSKKSRYVVEFKDGFVEKNNIKIGDIFKW